MVECDTINRDKMVSRCKDQRQQIVNKIKELGLEMKMEQISSNLPLAEQNKLLQDQLNEIEQRESAMMAKYRALMEEELKLTTKLDVQALNLGHIPSINNTEILAENNKKLQRLAEEREQCMFSMKEEIVELLDDLEMDLNATSLDILLITDDQKFDSLRQCDLDSVRNTLEDLREQVVKREAEVKEMVEQVVALYERLDVSPEDQCPLSSGRVCGLNELGKSENLEQVKKELKRMISLRAVNMRQIMEKSEAELVVLWN